MNDMLPRDSDDGHGHKYVHWTVDIATAFHDIGQNGIVSTVSCAKSDTSEFYDVVSKGEPAGSTATCKGMFQNAGKFMTMNVMWFKKGYSCTNIAWPVEDTVAPAPPSPKPRAEPAAKPKV